MRYRSLSAASVVLLLLAACKGNDSAINADLARDLASAKTTDALALAPHSGGQTVVSAVEQSPQGRSRMAPSSRSVRAVAHRTPHRDRVTRSPATQVASVAPAPTVTPSPAAATATDASVTVSSPTPRPQPVDVSYPSSDPGSGRGEGNGGGAGAIGGIIGAIGGAILRGGVVGGDGDHCDPRSHGGGGILINRRGPILRGTF